MTALESGGGFRDTASGETETRILCIHQIGIHSPRSTLRAFYKTIIDPTPLQGLEWPKIISKLLRGPLSLLSQTLREMTPGPKPTRRPSQGRSECLAPEGAE